ncbi:MAG: hypothetical protein VB979_01795 [Acinetobacter sp.]|uniref:hypothetical protein n=1 Tax=Acinetobacter TaxID=469 RepID=UPI003982AFEB
MYLIRLNSSLGMYWTISYSLLYGVSLNMANNNNCDSGMASGTIISIKRNFSEHSHQMQPIAPYMECGDLQVINRGK